MKNLLNAGYYNNLSLSGNNHQLLQFLNIGAFLFAPIINLAGSAFLLAEQGNQLTRLPPP